MGNGNGVIVMVIVGMYSFICQGTSTRIQRSDFFGLPSSCNLLLPV